MPKDDESDVTTEDPEAPTDGDVTPPSDEGVDFSDVPKEMLPYIQKARAQEKAKLYKERAKDRQELQEARKRLKEFESQPPKPEDKKKKKTEDDDVTELKESIKAIQDKLDASERRSVEISRRAELRQYRTDKIQEARDAGEDLVESLVMGDSEDAIDAALEVAKAEYLVIQSRVEQKAGRKPVKQVVVNTGAKNRPAGVAPTVSASVPSDASSALSLESIKEFATIENVRNGSYAKKRDEILAALRAGRIVSTTGA